MCLVSDKLQLVGLQHSRIYTEEKNFQVRKGTLPPLSKILMSSGDRVPLPNLKTDPI